MNSSLDSTSTYVAPPPSTKASSDGAPGAVTAVANAPSDDQGGDHSTGVQRGADITNHPGGGNPPGSLEAGGVHAVKATAPSTGPDPIEGVMQGCQAAPQQHEENGLAVVDHNTDAIMSALQAEFTDEAFQKFDPTGPLGQHLQEAAAVAAAALLPPPPPSQEIEAVPVDPFQVSNSVPVSIPALGPEPETNEIEQQQREEKKEKVNEMPQPQGDPPAEGAVEGGGEQAVLQQEVARRSPIFSNVDELDEDTARQLLIDSGWNISQSVRQGGYRQWYYRTPPPNTSLLGSIAAAVALWKKQVDEEHKQRGGGDADPYPIVTAFLNKKMGQAKKPASKKRKRGRSRA